jgi:tetratricopeptide (TPR) repeat protein
MALGHLDFHRLARGHQRYEVLDGLGRVQLGAGDLSAAVRSFLAAARVEDASGWRPAPDARARARRLAALALAAAGQLEPALHEIDAARADAGGGDEDAPLRHLAAQILWHLGRDHEAIEAAQACAGAAAHSGDADLVARGRDLAALAQAALTGGPLAPPEDAAPAAGCSPQDTAPEHPIDLHLVLWERDLLGDAGREAIERRIALLGERARARGARAALAASLHGHGAAALAAGRLDAAEPPLREALALHRQEGSGLGEALALERLGTLLGLRGRLDEGMELLAEGVVVAERALLLRHALVRLHAAQVRNRLAAGAPYAAEEALREASEAAARHGECVVCHAALRPEAVRVALARGRTGDAVAEADQLAGIARLRGGRGLAALARAARGRVLAAAGRTAEALAELGASREAFAAAGLRLEAARCARLEVRLRGPSALQDPSVRDLDGLLLVDADA